MIYTLAANTYDTPHFYFVKNGINPKNAFKMCASSELGRLFRAL